MTVTDRRALCPHGNVIELRIETVIDDAGVTTRVTQLVCRACMLPWRAIGPSTPAERDRMAQLRVDAMRPRTKSAPGGSSGSENDGGSAR